MCLIEIIALAALIYIGGAMLGTIGSGCGCLLLLPFLLAGCMGKKKTEDK